MSVPRDGVGDIMNIAELKKIKPCHRCGEYGHRYRKCPKAAKQVSTDNDLHIDFLP